MPSICLYFKVHQPFQLKAYQAGDVAVEPEYIDSAADEQMINCLADECYLPANEILLDIILKTRGKFQLSYSVSGTALELLQRYRPDVIDSFLELVNTGCVEILAETYHNSLSYLNSKKEFVRQVKKHSALVQQLFGITPGTFRNTELLYHDDLASLISSLGYRAILCEGVNSILEGRSPNQVYRDAGAELLLFLRNRSLSDDIAFRFDDRSWNEHPLTAEKFASWIHQHPQTDEVINLFMDYETFGMHKKPGSGIFEFLKALPEAILANDRFSFATPSTLCSTVEPAGTYSAQNLISWDNQDLHSCVWSTNRMQNNALKKIYSIEKLVKNSHSDSITDTWAMLQSADYFYSMALPQNHGDSYKYNRPFSSSEEIYACFTNIVMDFEIRLIKLQIGAKQKRIRRMETGIY